MFTGAGVAGAGTVLAAIGSGLTSYGWAVEATGVIALLFDIWILSGKLVAVPAET